jgi:hypothetical protein
MPCKNVLMLKDVNVQNETHRKSRKDPIQGPPRFPEEPKSFQKEGN